MNNYRNTARIIGFVFVAGMVLGIGGNILILSVFGTPVNLQTVSTNGMMLGIGASLWLMTVIGDATHGVLMFPILKRFNERVAIGYLTARIIDAVFIAVMILFILLQVPLAGEFIKAGANNSTLQALSAVFVHVNLYAYHTAMFTLGIAGLLLCYAFFAARLVPKSLALWGLIGYATILLGSLLEILGFPLNSMHTIPGGLWELFIGFWLIFKGFNPTAGIFRPAK